MKNKKILSLALALSLAFTALFPVNTYASIGHTTKTIDKSQTVKGEKSTIEVKHYLTYVVLEEDDPAVQKINKKLKSEKKYLTDRSDAMDSAEFDADERDYDDVYYDYTEQDVSFMSEDYVSVTSSWVWYAGGVGNYGISGLTFDLSTGKEIKKLTYFTKEKSLKKIKKTLKKMALKDDENLSGADVDLAIKGKKAKDFYFYLDENGDVVVCFGPYEMGYGGWARTYTLEGDIK